ncbi:MAG: type III-A CRISPR-associated RAMP protein Csm4 [Ignavibacteriae bacterium]|nr:type III-A CRISPR-associated RAMP protein Csm4 [Ignavibacteriota bacterium]NOH00231.1 type III-A CRISPR-associated RAMP protein Csm4 [Ignavibacteriota bacterium]
MNALILKTKPYSIFRLGAGSLNETDEIIHSDTLFAALINTHSKIFDNTEGFIKLFEKGEIKISSAFPMLTNKSGSNIYFLPKPELDYVADSNIKEEKKIKFISAGVFNYLQSNIQDDQKIRVSFTDKNYFSIIGSSYVVTKDELNYNNPINNFIAEIVTPKTKVHSESQDDSFYHETDIQLTPVNLKGKEENQILTPHFYFMFELKCNEEEKSDFFTCLRVLVNEGIGGERSAGKGLFEDLVESEIKINLNEPAKTQMLISIFNPKTQNEFDSLSYYEVIIRGGGSIGLDTEKDEDELKPEYSKYRKKQVRMIAEGAVANSNLEGRLVNVTPEDGSNHQVFRNGKAFTIPLG